MATLAERISSGFQAVATTIKDVRSAINLRVVADANGRAPASRVAIGSMAENLVVNGDMEEASGNQATGWSVLTSSGSVSLARFVDASYNGSASLLLTKGSNQADTTFVEAHNSIGYIDVTAGEVLEASCATAPMDQASANGFYYRIYWYNSANSQVGYTDAFSDAPIPAGWVVRSAQVFVPANARKARVSLFNWQSSTTRYLAVDAVTLRRAIGSSRLLDLSVTQSKIDLSLLARISAVLRYGLVGDGASRPISGITNFNGVNTTGYTLAQWRALVPQITALTNEIDGVAIQAALNTGATVRLPDGAISLLSFGLVTNGGETVIYGNKIQLRWTTNVSIGITHGTSAAPATGRFYFTGYCGLFKDASPGAGIALSLRYAETGSAPDYSGSLGKVLIRNWGAPAVQIIDFPRGMTLDEMIVWGADNSLVNGDGFSITGSKTRGTFGFQMYNCMTVNYRWGIGVDVNAKGGGEGFIIESCRSYAGCGFLRISNGIYNPSGNEYYQPPLWRILNCDWEGYGTAMRISGVSDCLVDGFFPVLNPKGNNAELDPGRIFDIQNSRNVKIRAGEIIILPGVINNANDALTGNGFPIIFKINKQCKNIRIEPQSILCNSTAYFMACEINDFGAGQVKEYGSTFDPAFPGDLRLDPGNNQICESAVRALGGTCNVETGEVSFIGSTAGTSNASGILSSTLPAGLFRTVNSTRSRVWNNDADVAPFAHATLKASTLTTSGFQAQWAQGAVALPNANVRQSYDIRGT